jgi:hypothetical protein
VEITRLHGTIWDFKYDGLFLFIFAVIYQPVNLETVKVYDLSTLQHVVWVTIENNGNRVQQLPEIFGHADGDSNGLPEPKFIKRQHTVLDTTIRHMVNSQIPCAPTLQSYQHSIVNNVQPTVNQKKYVEKSDPKMKVKNLKIDFVEELKERLSKMKLNEN